jgi:hypothetical protein
VIETMFGRRQTPRISHRPAISGYFVGLAVMAMIGLAGAALIYWQSAPISGPETDNEVPPPGVESLQQELLHQSKVIERLNRERAELLQRIAKLERISQIDQESVSRVQVQLKNDQNERLKLEEELLFLRSIVSTKASKGVLHLQRLRLQQGTRENSVFYAFTVSKVLKDPEYIEGAAYLSLNGKQGGAKRTLTLKDLPGDQQNSLKLRFKHFQNLEGELLLPDGFKPSGVTIEVKPAGKKFKPVKKSFKWVVQG